MGIVRRLATVLTTVALGIGLLALGAEAKGTFSWYSSSSPLKVTWEGREAHGYGSWSLLDESSGLRSRINANLRTKNGDSNNMAKATLVTQYRRCSTCTFSDHKTVNTASVNSSTYVLKTTSTDVPSTGTHARGKIRVTLDRRDLKPDKHSGWIFRGPTSY